MKTKTAKTWWVKIYLSGPLNVIEQVCRKECHVKGLCVTVDATKFIYTGGEEFGAVVGLINYPRFPANPASITGRAALLAMSLLDATYQDSVLIMTPVNTTWITKRDNTRPDRGMGE